MNNLLFCDSSSILLKKLTENIFRIANNKCSLISGSGVSNDYFSWNNALIEYNSLQTSNFCFSVINFLIYFLLIKLFQPDLTARTLKLAGHVGFDSLPDQLVNKSVQNGFVFNIMCIGTKQ